MDGCPSEATHVEEAAELANIVARVDESDGHDAAGLSPRFAQIVRRPGREGARGPLRQL